MEIASLIINAVLLLFTGVAAVAAYLQAQVAKRAQEGAESAQTDAEVARDEALRLSQEANDALIRQAAAQERANEIAATQLPADGARWLLEHVSGVRYVIRNIGNATAENLTIHEMNQPSGFLRHDYSTPVDVAPGDVLELTILSALGSPNVRLQLRWSEGGGPLLTYDTTIVAK